VKSARATLRNLLSDIALQPDEEGLAAVLVNAGHGGSDPEPDPQPEVSFWAGSWPCGTRSTDARFPRRRDQPPGSVLAPHLGAITTPYLENLRTWHSPNVAPTPPESWMCLGNGASFAAQSSPRLRA